MEDFEALCRRCTPIIYRYLLSLCGDPHLAEELTAETLYQAFLHIGSFRGQCKAETWLCQIAKHSLYREQRRRKKQVPLESLPLSAESPDLLDTLADREDALQLRQHLESLREPYREVFSLRVFGEQTFREIAARFGKSESWAKVTFYRAKNKLLQAMEDRS